jgi:predicted HNH restriction endonuclease
VITAAILNGVYTFIDGAKDGRTYSSLWIEYPGLWGAYKEGIYEWNDNAGRDVISVNLKNVKSIHEKIINTVKRFETKEEIRSEGNEIPYVKVSEELFRYSEDDTLPRNPAFKDITIKRANCRCELCGTENSSKDTDDNHFFEGHHLIIYSPKVQKRFKYCLDHPDNIVCLCPQCHREIHTSSEEKTKELLLKLFIKHNLLLRIFEIKNLQDIINDYIKH